MTTTGAPIPTLPPQQPARDTTRVIAIIALVVGIVALVAPIALTVVPMLAFGLLGGDSGSGFGEGDLGSGPSFGSTDGGRSVAVHDGRVSGVDLAGALGDIGPFSTADLTCEDVPAATSGATALCRLAHGPRTYVVVRFVDDEGGIAADWFSPGDPTP